MLFRFLLKTVRVRRRPSSVVTSQSGGEGEQKLAMLVQGLQLAEKVAEASGVPYLKGAIAFALAVAQCVQGYQSSDEGLNRLALSCVELMLAITDQVKDGSGLSQRMAALVKDLCKTLEEIETTAKDIVNRDGRTRRFFAQKDNNERLSVLHRDLSEAHLRFQTLTAIAKDAPGQSESDKVYDYSDIFLGDHYAAGEGWVAYNGVLDKSDENVIVKRYGGANRQARHEKDIQAFKERWHGNLLQYIGRSHPGAEQPYNLFRGITSDHVSTYVAQRFSENNKKGSIVALKLLRDLTNALAFTVGNTNSSSFDISKVHLNALGNFILVDLEPCLPTNKISKNDMPYWRNWQEICIELLAGDPTYEPNPSIEYYADAASQTRLEYLRPILGHIHYGGMRFKETSIEMAFKSEALLLSQAHTELCTTIENPLAPRDAPVLRAMWRRARELHYVVHFQEPLRVAVGDIGYISGAPPQFTRLTNVGPKFCGNDFFRYTKTKPLRSYPPKRWTTTVVQGIRRHTFRFRDSDATNLADWRNGRPRVQKDFLLRRINVPNESGLVVDCGDAWNVLSEIAAGLAAGHTERSITASNLILVVYFKQQSGSATFRLNKAVNPQEWREIWVREGFDALPDAIYFYESPPGGLNGVWGYFSFSPVPGTPHRKWTPESDDDGEAWGWTFQSDDWTVELSKPNIKQYIRYVQL